MTTKQYLSQIGKYDMIIKNKLNEIMQYKDIVECKVTNNEDDRVQKSSDGDKLGRFVPEIVDREKEIKTLFEKKDKIIKQIENMQENFMYEILYLVFVDNLDMRGVEKKLNYSKSKTYRLFNLSLSAFEQKYGKSYLNKQTKSA